MKANGKWVQLAFLMPAHITLPPWLPQILEIFKGLLTPAIGITTAYIAWQQWKTNERKAVLDRYERRLRIYERVIQMVRVICSNFSPEIPELLNFSVETAEADFLFGPEIREYIDEIYSRGVDLNAAKNEYRDYSQHTPPGYDHQEVVKVLKQQEEWFILQTRFAREKFRKYLDISQ